MRCSGESEPSLPPPELVDGAHRRDLALLAFDDHDAPELRVDPTPLVADAYPEAIRAYHGTEVLLRADAQPLELDGERVRSLRLTRFPPGCCFGALPQYDEWVLVELDAGLDSWPGAFDELSLRGRLQLGEEVDAQGQLTSLYRLDAARAD